MCRIYIRDGEGSHFLDQESYETLTLTEAMVGDGAMEYLVEGALLQLHKFNGNPIGLQLPIFVELDVKETEPGVKGDSSSGSVTKVAKLETGLEIRVPLFIKQGEKVKVATETGSLREGRKGELLGGVQAEGFGGVLEAVGVALANPAAVGGADLLAGAG
jgi:hypothetical protein